MSKKLLVTLTILVPFALTLPFVARTENSNNSTLRPIPPSASKSAEEPTAISTEDVPQVVSLELTPNGFEPRETTARPGKFLILLQNRTGRRDLRFYLIRENQERLADSEPQKRDWKAQVQLGPGTYIVGETNHPEWQSIIRVRN